MDDGVLTVRDTSIAEALAAHKETHGGCVRPRAPRRCFADALPSPHLRFKSFPLPPPYRPAASFPLPAANPPQPTPLPPPPQSVGSDRVKSIVFGGLDGVITTFSIVAAVAGAQLPIETALLMGFSNLIADGISMGLGDYLSSKAEMEYEAGESKKEMWEFENSREIEEAEQEKQFQEQGMSKEDAVQVTATLAKYPEIFHAIHLQGELGFGPPDKDASPATDGAVSAWQPRPARPGVLRARARARAPISHRNTAPFSLLHYPAARPLPSPSPQPSRASSCLAPCP